MNLDPNKIVNILQNKADWIAFLISAWEREGGNIDYVINHYVGGTYALDELMRSLTDLKYLKYKLVDSPHLYSGLFKLGLMGYIAAELGVVPSKYKKTLTKIMTGAGIGAITLPASGGFSETSTLKGSSSSGNSDTWRYTT